MKYFWILLLVLLFTTSCKNKVVKEQSTSKQNLTTTSVDKHVMNVINANIKDSSMHYSVSNDSLFIKSLNATLFKIRALEWFDVDNYILIKDNHTRMVYKIVDRAWPSFGSFPSPELQLYILKSKEEIETINYDFLGLEAFLNQCNSVSEKELNINTLDSIIRFVKPNYCRIKDSTVISRFFHYNLHESEINKTKNWDEEMCEILKSKLKSNYVLLYRSGVFLIYFELNPGKNFDYFQTQAYQLSLEEYQEYYNQSVKGNNYNLRYFRVSNY